MVQKHKQRQNIHSGCCKDKSALKQQLHSLTSSLGGTSTCLYMVIVLVLTAVASVLLSRCCFRSPGSFGYVTTHPRKKKRRIPRKRRRRRGRGGGSRRWRTAGRRSSLRPTSAHWRTEVRTNIVFWLTNTLHPPTTCLLPPTVKFSIVAPPVKVFFFCQLMLFDFFLRPHQTKFPTAPPRCLYPACCEEDYDKGPGMTADGSAGGTEVAGRDSVGFKGEEKTLSGKEVREVK